MGTDDRWSLRRHWAPYRYGVIYHAFPDIRIRERGRERGRATGPTAHPMSAAMLLGVDYEQIEKDATARGYAM
jgi:hypothetical protein